MNKAENTNRMAMLVHAAASIAVAAVYFTTMAPSLDKIDSGELAAVQATGGVAHPTGYPLFTLLGWLFSRIPMGSTIWQLNLLSMLFVAGGVFLFMRACLGLLQTQAVVQKAKTNSAKQAAPAPAGFMGRHAALVASLLGGWMLAFSKTVWETSTSIEVYSLHVLLLGLLFITVYKAYRSPVGTTRPWVWVAVALALCFSNHLTTVVMIPALGWLFFSRQGFTGGSFKTLGIMLACFFPILILMYLWLPLRSASSPAMNWGSTDGWDFFWYHVSGKQFRVWWFTGQEAFNKKFHDFFLGGDFMAGIGKQFAWGGFILGLVGVVFSFLRDKKVAVFLLLLFLTTIFYVSNYSIPDLAPYYLMAYFCVSYWAAITLHRLFTMSSHAAIKWVFAGVGLVMAVVPVVLHHSSLNKKDLWMYDDYSRAALESLPPNAMVITYQWDHFVSGAYYLQQAEKVRPDVLLVEYEIMRNRLWYYDHLKRHAPELMEQVKPEADDFFDALEPFYFDSDESVFPELTRTFPPLFWSLISEGRKTRPVFIGPEVLWERINVPPRQQQIQLAASDTVVPGAYFYQVIPKAEARQYTDVPMRSKPIRMDEFRPKEEYYTGRLRYYLVGVAHDRALYELQMGKPDRARMWRDEALRLRPTAKLHPALLAL